MDTISQQFLLNEFNALRSEIELQMTAMYELVPYTLLASAVIWTWLFTHKETYNLPSKVGLIAPILSILFGFRAFFINVQIGRMGDYILLLESKLTLPEGLGWETHSRSMGLFAKSHLSKTIK